MSGNSNRQTAHSHHQKSFVTCVMSPLLADMQSMKDLACELQGSCASRADDEHPDKDAAQSKCSSLHAGDIPRAWKQSAELLVEPPVALGALS